MRHRLVVTVVAVLYTAVSACSSTRLVPPPGADVDAFAAAWSDLDADAMHARFSEDALQEWSETQLEALLDGLAEEGEITQIEVARSGPIDRRGPDELAEDDENEATATAPITIVYESAALDEPIELDSELELIYDYDLDTWLADWSEETALGLVDGAAGFRVTRRWGKRAAIVDRQGRTLARGNGENRTYPYGSTGGATIGHLAPLDPGDSGTGESRPRRRLIGASGLEAAFEERLAGTPGASVAIVDGGGDVLEVVAESEPIAGKPLRVTLDVEMQQAAAAAFGATTGGAVVMHPATGDLLAIVSSSEVDPNSYVGVAGIDPFNRALSGLYPPGSAMKVVTAAAALEEEVVSPDTQLSGPKEYRGVRNFESGEFGTLDFATAVEHSVNTAFAQVAEDLGARRLTRYAEAFGFNTDPDMSLEAATSSFPEPADEGDLLWSSIGQAQVLASPLQMASVSATIANDGRRMEPRITREDRVRGERVVSRATARTLTALLEGVVQGGTGSAASIAGLAVAGKTGTAEVDVAGERKNHAWFVAFAPAADPAVAVAVVSEYGGIGGQVAAPLARAILLATLPLAG